MARCMTGERDGANARIEFDVAAERLEAAGREIRRDRRDRGIEKRTEKSGRSGFVSRIQPVVRFDLADSNHRVGKCHCAVRDHTAHMILMQMREQDLVDLFGLITRGAQIAGQPAATVAIQHARAGVDQNQLRTGIDQERIDRSLHRRLQKVARQVLRDFGLRHALNHGIDRKGMCAVEQCGHFEIADHDPVKARALCPHLRRGGQRGARREARGNAQKKCAPQAKVHEPSALNQFRHSVSHAWCNREKSIRRRVPNRC